MWYIHITGYYSAFNKRRKSWGHYGKHMKYASYRTKAVHLYEISKVVQFLKQKAEWGLFKTGEGGNRELLFRDSVSMLCNNACRVNNTVKK